MPTTPDVGDRLRELVSEIVTYSLNTAENVRAAVTTPEARYWLRLCVIVCGYIMVRPLIDMVFRKSFERSRERELARKKEQEDAFGARGKTAKMSTNSLRAPGRILGEVDTDDEEGINTSNNTTGRATSVPSWGKNARKRQKRFLKNLEREAERRAEELTEKDILGLLDWSESEGEKEAVKKKS